jgi:tetratricopeptide (TPR) repeat protein
MESPSIASSAPGPSFLGTLALVFVAIVALFAIDTFLAKVEQSETAAQAARLFREGQRLAQECRSADSIARLRAALALSRDNPEYQLALADALFRAGRLADADALLTTMLQNDATDGGANLLMARVLAQQGKLEAAEFYYHMAIYGRWPQDAAANRIRARFELIDLLVKEGNRKALLAELLPLQDEAPVDLETRRRIAHLFLLAGSPGRAADMFRQILRENREDADAYAGLGEAEIASGNYRIAETNLEMAARLKPAEEDIRKRLELARQVLALDPMLRGLGAAERYRRTRELVELALDSVKPCAGDGPSGTLQTLTDEAGQALQRRLSPAQQDEATEANLELAERLWQARQKECKQTTQPGEEPLALVLAKDSAK